MTSSHTKKSKFLHFCFYINGFILMVTKAISNHVGAHYVNYFNAKKKKKKICFVFMILYLQLSISFLYIFGVTIIVHGYNIHNTH